MQADISDIAQVTRLFDEAERRLGPLDIVVANAGVAMFKPLAECTDEDYEHVFGANTRGTFATLREAARRLCDGGRIVVTSTAWTRMWFTDISLYLGSKGAVEQFVRALAHELGRAASPSTPCRRASRTPTCCRNVTAPSRRSARRSGASGRTRRSPPRPVPGRRRRPLVER